MFNTTLVTCKRVGRGWSIEKIYSMDGHKIGFECIEKGTQEIPKIKSLSKWLKHTGRDICLTDPKMLTSVYLFQFEAPGSFCQIFWECDSEEHADRLRQIWLKRDHGNGIWGGYGDYLLDRGLNDLTTEEYHKYKSTVIDA